MEIVNNDGQSDGSIVQPLPSLLVAEEYVNLNLKDDNLNMFSICYKIKESYNSYNLSPDLLCTQIYLLGSL